MFELAHRRTGIFLQGEAGGGGGGEPFAKKILTSWPNFYETGNEGTMHYQWPTYEVKIFLHMNLSYELRKHFKT